MEEEELGAQMENFPAVQPEELVEAAKNIPAAQSAPGKSVGPNKLDALYRALHTSIKLLPETDAAVTRIKQMVSAPDPEPSPLHSRS